MDPNNNLNQNKIKKSSILIQNTSINDILEEKIHMKAYSNNIPKENEVEVEVDYDFQEDYEIEYFLDLHGHSRKLGSFIYGCKTYD